MATLEAWLKCAQKCVLTVWEVAVEVVAVGLEAFRSEWACVLHICNQVALAQVEATQYLLEEVVTVDARLDAVLDNAQGF